MTKNIFSVLLLCLLLYACAASQTNPDNAPSAKPDNAQATTPDRSSKNTSDFVVKDQDQPTRVSNDQLSTPTVQYLYIVKDVKMRKEARNLSKVVVTLKKGELVEKIDASKTWVKVKTSSGKTGWVSNKFVSENK